MADAGEADPLDEAALLALKHDRGELWVEPSGFALRRGAEVDLAVAPEARDAGVGGRLAQLAFTRPMTVWSHGDHPAALRLAARHGLDRARELWVMRRSLTDLPALSPPTGVSVRGFQDADTDDVLAINAAAFAHHPEQGGMDLANFTERQAEEWFDPAGLLLAVEGDEALGFHWTKRHSPGEGEVYVVAVAPGTQGRGLGKVLTLAGLHHLREAGAVDVHLYVEADNAAAVSVYGGLGFRHSKIDTHVQYRG